MKQINNEIIKSAREKIYERVKGQRPETNFMSDDDYFDAINQDYDNYDKRLSDYELNNDKLIAAFDEHPKLGELFLKLINGEDPYLYMLDNFGDDVIDASINPDLRHRANKRYNEGNAKRYKDRDLDAIAQENLPISVNALENAMYRTGITEQEAVEAYRCLVDIVQDATVDKVSVDTWMLIINGLRYDREMESAAYNGEIRGKNSKIELSKRNLSAPSRSMPPNMAGYGSGSMVHS
ncbi:MAG: hypothetical protein R3Y22_09015, partial [Bacteroidales bacterium]